MVIWLDLDIIKIKPPQTGSNRMPKVKSKKCIYKNCPKPPKTGLKNADISTNPNIQLSVKNGYHSHRTVAVLNRLKKILPFELRTDIYRAFIASLFYY